MGCRWGGIPHGADQGNQGHESPQGCLQYRRRNKVPEKGAAFIVLLKLSIWEVKKSSL